MEERVAREAIFSGCVLRGLTQRLSNGDRQVVNGAEQLNKARTSLKHLDLT